MKTAIKEFDEFKKEMEDSEIHCKEYLKSELTNFSNLLRINPIDAETPKKIFKMLINYKKQNILKEYSEISEKCFTKQKENSNYLKKKLEICLNLFIFDEILKQTENEKYFKRKEFKSLLVYSFKNDKIESLHKDLEITILNIKMYDTTNKFYKEIFPGDISKIIDRLIPHIFLIPFSLNSFLEYLLVRDFYELAKIFEKSDNLNFVDNLYGDIIKDKNIDEAFKGIKGVKIRLLAFLKNSMNEKEFKKIEEVFLKIFKR